MVYYDKYDLTDHIRSGENVVGILLGNGLINNPGGKTWDFDKAGFRSSPKFAIHFHSDEVRFEADDKFKTADSPILFDDYRCGEIYDAGGRLRMGLPGLTTATGRLPKSRGAQRNEKILHGRAHQGVRPHFPPFR